jgi:inorganic pyrophosphatase
MDFTSIPTFASDNTFHVVVESPRGSSLKLKYEPRWQAMSVSRPLTAGLVFPFDWGFVPSTRNSDGDPIDAFLMWDVAAFPGVVLPCRPLGVIQIEQNAENFDPSRRVRNDRVLALPSAARRENEWTGVQSIPERVREECIQFVLAAGALEGKNVRVLGWGQPADALALITSSQIAR